MVAPTAPPIVASTVPGMIMSIGWPKTSPRPPLARIAAMKACPDWVASSDCGCGNNRCALGKGRDGVVSHQDCFACLGFEVG